MKRSGPIKRQSQKRQDIAPHRRKFVKEYLGQHPICEAYIPDVCRFEAIDVHEIKTRARGGSILDSENVVALCRACHNEITGDPAWAERNGYMVHSWATEDDMSGAKLARNAWKMWALDAWEMDPMLEEIFDQDDD